jgi:hypothetical protein
MHGNDSVASLASFADSGVKYCEQANSPKHLLRPSVSTDALAGSGCYCIMFHCLVNAL